ncbi:hypothetical protein BJY00DRAFT_255744 [Aspergillus carlsbadensis]|nr:hypothetical protein BJY00DRAFT_255744 [Aspergillus carlsbadensis]
METEFNILVELGSILFVLFQSSRSVLKSCLATFYLILASILAKSSRIRSTLRLCCCFCLSFLNLRVMTTWVFFQPVCLFAPFSSCFNITHIFPCPISSRGNHCQCSIVSRHLL